MRYIPCRAWLLISAFLAEVDVFTYGELSHSTDILLMHAAVTAQIVLVVLLSVPRLYPWRRFLVLGMGIHNVVWTGLVTEQVAHRVSGVHQNTFAVLPFYCSFACVVAAQVLFSSSSAHFRRFCVGL